MKKFVVSVLVAGLMLTGTQIAPTQASATGFDDVLQTNPYAEYINDLATKKVVVGYDGNFNPSTTLTRAEFATMLVRAFNLPLTSSPVKFADSRGHWGAKYIQSAYQAGAVSGTSDTTFEPDAKVRREEAAAMVWRLLTKNGVEPTTKDIQVTDADSWAKEAVDNVLDKHLYGVEVQNGVYLSQQDMTRQQAAALFDLALKVTPAPKQVVINPTTNPTNLIDQADGSKQLGNITLDPQMVKNNNINESQLKNNLSLFGKLSIQINGQDVTISVPDTGSDSVYWDIEDYTHHNDWSGANAKTFNFKDTSSVSLGLYNPNTAQVLADATLIYKNGNWSVKYPEF